MNPPVFAVDEKPQIQALNRTAPMMPMMPTTAQRRSHDFGATAPSICSRRSTSPRAG